MTPQSLRALARRHTGALALVGALSVALPAQEPTFKSGTRIVPMYVTVIDTQKRLVPDLVKDDFEIFDNEKPQAIVFFESAVTPVTVVVMLDTSASMTGSLDLLNDAAEQFLLRLLPEDKARVGAFNDKLQLYEKFTNDRDKLISFLQMLDFGNPTRLYDAIELSLDELRGIEGRRVVLVFTDGDDTASKVGLGDVLDRARAEEAMVYAIGLQSDYFNGVQRVRSKPDRGLRKLAEETGGGYFELQKSADLASTFTRVAQELHSQYIVGFTPTTLDGRVHKLAVKVKRPGMTARARKSYVATSERSPTS